MVSRLHYITNDYPYVEHWELAEQVCQAGADWVQLRVKNKSATEWLDIALKTKTVCEKYNAKLIINDNVEIARKVNAYGIHLGKTDMNPAEARKILGNDVIIGATANTFEDILMLSKLPIDYIGLGPFRFTTTKKLLSPVLGLDGMREIVQKCKEQNIHIPIVAIGGIKQNDVAGILETGIHGVAVSSVISESANITETTKEFLKLLQ